MGEQKDAFEKQLSVFDSFVKTVVEESEKFGFSDEAAKLVLEELHKAKKGYEKGIQEIERIRQEELERQHQEEQARLCRITSMEIPMDWENSFLSDQRAEGIQAESAGDGLILSLTNLGRVDIEYISLITGLEMPHVISALRGSIYQNPDTWEECFYKGWETAEEYLSGNLRRKWKTAKSADEKYHGYFKENIAALEQAMPEPLRYKDIYVTLGSPWVPTDVIDEFIEHLFGKNRHRNPEYYKTKHDEITGSWEIPNKLRYGSNVAVTVEYGTAG